MEQPEDHNEEENLEESQEDDRLGHGEKDECQKSWDATISVRPLDLVSTKSKIYSSGSGVSNVVLKDRFTVVRMLNIKTSS